MLRFDQVSEQDRKQATENFSTAAAADGC